MPADADITMNETEITQTSGKTPLKSPIIKKGKAG